MMKILLAIVATAMIIAGGWLLLSHLGGSSNDAALVDTTSSFEGILQAKNKSVVAPPATPEDKNEKNNVNTGSTSIALDRANGASTE